MPDARNSWSTACGLVLAAVTVINCVDFENVADLICTVSPGETVRATLANDGCKASEPWYVAPSVIGVTTFVPLAWMVKLALVLPAGMVSVAGILMSLVMVEDSRTLTPPAGTLRSA